MYIFSIILSGKWSLSLIETSTSESYVESVQLESQNQATVRWWGWEWNLKRGNYKNHLSGTCVRGNIVATTFAIKILLLNWSFLFHLICDTTTEEIAGCE